MSCSSVVINRICTRILFLSRDDTVRRKNNISNSHICAIESFEQIVKPYVILYDVM